MANCHSTTDFLCLPKTRKDAKSIGSIKYFTGKPCPHGHVSPRYTGHGSCVECGAVYMRSPERRAYDAKYYAENREKVLQQSREYIRKNSDQVVARVARWQARNPERVRFYKAHYKAKRRAAEACGMTWRDLKNWERGAIKACHWCGKKCADDYHVDHYQPLARGGAHAQDNLVIACPPCNRKKSCKDPYEFAQEVGRLF